MWVWRDLGLSRSRARETEMASPFPLAVVFFLFSFSPASSQRTEQRSMEILRDLVSVKDWVSSDFCSWRGVTCRNPNGTVEELLLPREGLAGDNISIISELRSLKKLDLCGNSLRGQIPSSFGNLKELQYLDLSMNKLSGEIPGELETLKELQELHISGNKLSGGIPKWVGELPQIRVFSAYENMLTGEIPEKLGSFSNFRVLNLHSNGLTGRIPGSIFSSDCKLETLILTMNKLEGDLPSSMGSCSKISNLRIGNNNLSGEIPPTIGGIESLTYFEADNNLFSGEIPPELARCSNLTLLNLASNRLSGEVPSEIGTLKNLQEFIISRNNLSGEIPNSLLTGRSLSKLDLTGNMIAGELSGDLCMSSRLQFLLLGDNSISGEIPAAIGNCVKLLELQLGGNKLEGRIPPEIGSIRNLQVSLNLSFNGLEGELPREMGKLDKLVSLDLSRNQLAGEIPGELSGMLSLITVDFSDNQFSGPIPIFGPFQKSPISSFSGNDRLCGEPLKVSCETGGGAAASRRCPVSYKISLAVIGGAVSAATLVVILFALREKQGTGAAEDGKLKAAPPGLPAAMGVFPETLKQAVDFDSLVRATMKEENKLRKGGFGNTYRAEMPSGLTLAVEKFKFAGETAARHRSRIIRELERFFHLGHPNLLNPIGFMIYDDVALVLHVNSPNGTLAELLFAEEKSPPDWRRRLRVAGGAAEGLSCLHQNSVLHLDISSSNIFLDKDHNALFGQIEISKVMDPVSGTASISAIAGSFGYIPPEYAYTMKVTEQGNVYSFGVVLMEVLTSRRAVGGGLGEGMDLAKWVRGAGGRGEMAEQILDSRISSVSFSFRRQMLAVLAVAILCTDPIPGNRPTMKMVVRMLRMF